MLATYFCNYMFIGDKYKILELIMIINYTNIDLNRDFLQHVGGMEGNSFINILQTDTETGEDENHNQPEIILTPHTMNLIN